MNIPIDIKPCTCNFSITYLFSLDWNGRLRMASMEKEKMEMVSSGLAEAEKMTPDFKYHNTQLFYIHKQSLFRRGSCESIFIK